MSMLPLRILQQPPRRDNLTPLTDVHFTVKVHPKGAGSP